MSTRPGIYVLYNEAKKALGRGSSICQQAHELSKETESKLAKAATIASQVRFLRDSLHNQLLILQKITIQINAEEEQIKLEFATALRDLDLLDADLNDTLETLKKTTMPAELSSDHAREIPQDSTSLGAGKSLFEFADENAVEGLKSELRQVIDDMQENQEALSALRVNYSAMVRSLEQVWSTLPHSPDLPPAHGSNQAPRTSTALPRSSLSMSNIARGYSASQEEHITEMAGLLLSLSQHYDHSFMLFKSEATLQTEELAELTGVVEHDALQLEDVISELEERVGDLEDDVTIVGKFASTYIKVQSFLLQAFRRFEQLGVDKISTTLKGLRSACDATRDRLDISRQRLIGLTDHYRAFGRSYDALILEVDRRTRYEATIVNVLEQTRQTLERLAVEEMSEREQFIQDHASSLPGDIWPGISDRPIVHDVFPAETIAEAPHLPGNLIKAARSRMEGWSDAR